MRRDALLVEVTLARTGKPDRGAKATAPGEVQASVGGRTADPYETSKLAHRCRPFTELEVT